MMPIQASIRRLRTGRSCAAGLLLAAGLSGCATPLAVLSPAGPAAPAATSPVAAPQAAGGTPSVPAVPTLPTASPPPPATATPGSAERSGSDAIRVAHLHRLDEHLTVAPEELKRTCRYESEIETRPPAKKVVLTFDDGPQPGQTERILDVLKKYGIHAAFFMIAKKAEAYPELVARVRDEGHMIIANHSWDHPNFHDISVAEQEQEVRRADTLMSADFHPRLFRYPYGNATCETNDLVHSLGYRIVGWHVDSCDWAFDKAGSVDAAEALSCGVTAQYRHDFVGHVVSALRARNGGIVLMHEIHPNTIAKLDEIVRQVLADGFQFTDLDDAGFAESLR